MLLCRPLLQLSLSLLLTGFVSGQGASSVPTGGQGLPPTSFPESWRPYTLVGENIGIFPPGHAPGSGPPLSANQIRDRLLPLVGKARWVRFFGFSLGQDQAPVIAKQLGFQVAAGAWLDGNAATNQVEIDTLVQLSLNGSVDIAIVGSEVILRGDLSAAQLIQHLQNVRQRVPSSIPVTTADVYTSFYAHPGLVTASDVVFVNLYPFWEGEAIDFAVKSLACRYQAFRNWVGGKQVWVSETGWPSQGQSIGAAVPDPVNAARYFLEAVSWARLRGVNYLWFASHDEAWKVAFEGPLGAHWGLRDALGRLKPGRRPVFQGVWVHGNWEEDCRPGGPGVPDLQWTFVPAIGSHEDLRGQVRHINPMGVMTVTYIKVAGNWWIKPTSQSPKVGFNVAGEFTTDITTGGSDPLATEIASFLLPYAYDPPIVLGAPNLPPSLFQDAIDFERVVR